MNRNKYFDYGFMALGLLIQVVTYLITFHLSPFTFHLSTFSFICGCLGVCSVCLTAQGKMAMYVFGFSQVLLYLYISWKQHLYGQVAINAFYFASMVYGVFAWRKRLQADSQTVATRRLPRVWAVVLLVATILVSGLTGWGLSAWTNDQQPYLDAFTTIPALVAQVLMILVFCEHWYIWLAVDVLSVVMWIYVGDYCLAAQYVFWCANCLYGIRNWKTLSS